MWISVFFFFKQKTAYEMRSSDWSSDVCSSDLPYLVFGVLADLLRRRYGEVRYARNITDVDDKINNAAREQGVPISTITDRFAAAYREDMAALGITPPDTARNSVV